MAVASCQQSPLLVMQVCPCLIEGVMAIKNGSGAKPHPTTTRHRILVGRGVIIADITVRTEVRARPDQKSPIGPLPLEPGV
jgi:hypothetical protein